MLDRYTYKNITLYIVNKSHHVHEFDHKHTIMFELGSFTNRA